MINVILNGANGRMGQAVAQLAAKSGDIRIAAGADIAAAGAEHDFPVYPSVENIKEDADLIVDFSRPEALCAVLSFALRRNLPAVIATTGLSAGDKALIASAAEKIPVFQSANMSLGVNLQMELSKIAAAFFGEAYDIEIIEKHHNQKIDSPSGTALAIADAINESFTRPKEYVFGRHSKTQKRGGEIGIHAVRGGTMPGEHSVLFLGSDEMLEISHSAQSRQIFAFGALRAARFIVGKPAGFYNMSDIINESAITRIYSDGAQAVITMPDMPFSPAAVADIFAGIADRNIKIDIISQTSPRDGKASLSFSVPQSDLAECVSALKKHSYGAAKIITDESLTKLTVEGAGMQRQSGVAARLFGALAEKDIGIYIITTSETKISFCVDSAKEKDAIAAVSEAFSL